MKDFKGFKKGVNLGGWLSQCDYREEHLENFITEEDFKKIASWGMDHVRVPIDYNVIQNDDGTVRESGFCHIEKAVSMCEKYGLNIILDLHKTVGYSFDKGEKENGFFENTGYQERFYSFWAELARRYGNRENIAFELLNEVTDKEFSAKWNEIAKECIKRIRLIAENTVILVGSYWNNSVSAVKDLDPPYDDKIVYNFHCYDPLTFTHQDAHWVDHIDVSGRRTYEESGYSADKFMESFKEAKETADKNGTVLYCGEYGVIDNASPEDAMKWYKDINKAFEHYGIGRAAWNYKEKDFGLADERMKPVIEELVKYL
ncbi:MAG: glycoside hydrolase family 5 protein [Ruminiclostridium sp.]|mgnify:CR=1 FL=1|jgi:aryl-phospho-beta-D-glucosidase BglC (GH1 family)|nr:glycoside hydrolase family 5 protein [Ruminiclostridium sp.]